MTTIILVLLAYFALLVVFILLWKRFCDRGIGPAWEPDEHRDGV